MTIERRVSKSTTLIDNDINVVTPQIIYIEILIPRIAVIHIRKKLKICRIIISGQRLILLIVKIEQAVSTARKFPRKNIRDTFHSSATGMKHGWVCE